jgi:protein-tyrosine kinase
MDRIQAALEKARFHLADPGICVERKAPPHPQTANEAQWAAIPQFEAGAELLENNRVVASDDHPFRAHYDMLRTAILTKLRQNNWTTVAITSPSAGCGKTSTAVNLALSLARQKDLRTLLIDLDLRSPAVGRLFGIASSPPLERVLRGEIDFKECLVRWGDNLAIAANGRPTRIAAELLQSASAARVLRAMQQLLKPDVIIFDLPPMLGVDDVMAALPSVDAAVLVAAAGKTTLYEVDICEQSLAEQGKMLGVVLNKCRYHPDNYGY